MDTQAILESSSACAATCRIDFGALPDDAFIRERDLVPAIVPVARATWWRWVADGRAPSPTKLGPGVSAWRVADIRLFLSSKQQPLRRH